MRASRRGARTKCRKIECAAVNERDRQLERARERVERSRKLVDSATARAADVIRRTISVEKLAIDGYRNLLTDLPPNAPGRDEHEQRLREGEARLAEYERELALIDDAPSEQGMK